MRLKPSASQVAGIGELEEQSLSKGAAKAGQERADQDEDDERHRESPGSADSHALCDGSPAEEG